MRYKFSTHTAHPKSLFTLAPVACSYVLAMNSVMYNGALLIVELYTADFRNHSAFVFRASNCSSVNVSFILYKYKFVNFCYEP